MSTNKQSDADIDAPLSPPTRVIPKFSSFAPVLAAPVPPPPAISTSHNSDKERRRESKHRHRRHRSRSRSRSRSRHRHSSGHDRSRDRDRHRRIDSSSRRNRKDDKEDSRRRHRSRRSPSTSPQTVVSSTTRLASPRNSKNEPPKPWFIDTKGDENNLIYGTIYRYAIPTYRRTGRGRILGLPRRIVIDREKDDGKGLVLRILGDGKSDGSRPDRYVYAKPEKKGLKRLKTRKDEIGTGEEFMLGSSFVPLSRQKPSKTQEEESDDEWRGSGLLGQVHNTDNAEDVDLEGASESDSDVEYVGGAEWGDRQRMVEFVRRVESEPTNVDAWLAYVDQQDVAIGTGNRKRSAAERTSIAEVKLDILTKALTKLPNNERLLLRFMEVAQIIWDSHKVLSKWGQILKDNPTVISLWTRYLNFRQIDVVSFTYPEGVKCFSDCLEMLRTAAFRDTPGSPSRKEIEDIYVYVLLRISLIMHESGYQELSTATLQAILELNFFSPIHIIPPSSQREHEDILAQLETFWDSEVPRIGEEDAKGWASFVMAGEVGDAPEPVNSSFELQSLNPMDPFSSWITAEDQWSQKPSMPARTTDDVEEDDPYRVVLFSDLKPFMLRLSCPTSIDELLDAFLVANGLPSLSMRCSNENFMKDPFLWNSLRATSFGRLDEWFWPKKEKKWDMGSRVWEGMEPEKPSGKGEDPFIFQMRNYPLGEESYFSKSNGWFSFLQDMKLDGEKTTFIRHALKSVIEQTSHESLAIYYLAWEWANSPKSVKKVAKTLLQKFKTSLRLWSAFAQIEWYDSGRDAGCKVFNLALNMSKGFSEDSKRNIIYLWHAWIWEELQLGNANEARRLILSVSNSQPHQMSTDYSSTNFPKSQLLASRQYLQEQQLRYTTMHPLIAAVYTDLYALLEYLCSPLPSLTNVTNIYTSFAKSVSLDPAVHELTLFRNIRIIHLHITTTKPYKPSALRTALESALSTFPHNTGFLSLYLSNESRTKIENRVRAILSEKNAISVPASAVFAIWTELHMSRHWSKHSVRHLFESACEDQNTKNSVLLWRMWLEFEVRVKAWENAKMVMWRAMRECPWSKEIVVVGLRLLQGALTMEEMWKCIAIVANEKELRIHDTTELEDAWEEIRMAVGEKGRGGGLGMVLPDDASDVEMDD